MKRARDYDSDASTLPLATSSSASAAHVGSPNPWNTVVPLRELWLFHVLPALSAVAVHDKNEEEPPIDLKTRARLRRVSRAHAEWDADFAAPVHFQRLWATMRYASAASMGRAFWDLYRLGWPTSCRTGRIPAPYMFAHDTYLILCDDVIGSWLETLPCESSFIKMSVRREHHVRIVFTTRIASNWWLMEDRAHDGRGNYVMSIPGPTPGLRRYLAERSKAASSSPSALRDLITTCFGVSLFM